MSEKNHLAPFVLEAMNPFLFALLAVLMTLTPAASAEPTKAEAPALPNDVGLSSNETGQAATDPTSQARVLYLKGNAAFKDDDLIIARDYYKKSLELRESFDAFCNLGRAEELSVLLDGAYYHLGLCVKYYPPDEELAATGRKYAELQREVAKRLSAEELVALDMKISAHRLKISEEPVSEAPVEPAVVATSPAEPAEMAGPTEAQRRRTHVARTAVSVGLGVLGAAGVGVGAAFLVDSQSKRDEADELRGEMQDDGINCSHGEDNDALCATLAKLIDKSESKRTTGIILTASGGTLLVGSVLLYLLWPEPKAKQSALISRTLGQTASNQRASRGQFGSVWVRPDVQVHSTKGTFTWGLAGSF